eukprot:2682344-Prymnesium_polylepis.2
MGAPPTPPICHRPRPPVRWSRPHPPPAVAGCVQRTGDPRDSGHVPHSSTILRGSKPTYTASAAATGTVP